MSAVPLKEVVEALREAAHRLGHKEFRLSVIDVADRIEQHGIAPPEEMEVGNELHDPE